MQPLKQLLAENGDDDSFANSIEFNEAPESDMEIWNRVCRQFEEKYPSLSLSIGYFDGDGAECYDTMEPGVFIAVNHVMIPNPEAADLNLTCESFSTFG